MKKVILASALALSVLTPANAHDTETTRHVIHDGGGSVHVYELNLKVYNMMGTNVIIDGPCMSACTMYLGVAESQICATDQGEFWFHSAFVLASDKRNTQPLVVKAIVKRANKRLMNTYPQNVKNWFAKNGGLTSDWVRIKANKLVRKCP